MKKILLIGHGGFYNRGCEAIVRGTVAIIRHFLPDAHITLVSGTPDMDTQVLRKTGISVDQVVPASLPGHKKPSLGWLWQTLDRRLFSGNIQFQDYLHRRHFQEADAVVSIGGDNFSEDYGRPIVFFESLRYAKQFGKKTVIWGASVGPFKHEVERWAAILRSCDLITAREDNTVAYLQSLGCTGNVQRVSDPAFCMPASTPTDWALSKEEGKLVVGLGISDLIPRYKISRDQYYRTFVEFTDYLRTNQNAHILLVPHVIQPGTEYGDDFRACNEVTALLATRESCQVLPSNLDATEMKHCIAQCDYFIGARTHSTIAGLSSLVPTGSIGYSVKAIGINNDLLGTDAYVLPHDQLSTRGVVGLFEKMQANRVHIIDQLRQEVPRAQERAMQAGKHLLHVLG